MADFRKSTAWFALLFIFLVVGLMSLGTCNSTEQTRDSTQVDETKVTEKSEVTEEKAVDYSQLASESDPDWVKPPYYHDSTASYIPGMYGMIAQNARENHIGKSFFPSIQGLYFNSCMESCRRDYCKSKRAILTSAYEVFSSLCKGYPQRVCLALRDRRNFNFDYLSS
jgi:hypothetical protein